jgi:branched-chain amino acid transport system substrate-binding protein
MRTHRVSLISMLVLLLLAVAVMFALSACGSGTTTTTAAASGTTTGGGTETTAPAGTTTSGATGTTAGQAAGEPIKVGVIAALTGSGAAPMASVMNGLNLEIDAINEAGGVNGRPIQLVIVDDASTVDKATAQATKLIQQDKVTAILGPFPPYEVPAIRQICEQAQMPQVIYQPPSAAEMKAATLKWSFTCSQTVRYNGSATAQMMKEAGYKNVVAVCDSLPTYTETAQFVKEFGEAAGISVTIAPDTWDVADADVTPVASKLAAFIQNAKPDAVVLECNPIHEPVVMKVWRGLGMTLPVIGPPTTALGSVFSQGPEVMEGMVFPGALLTDPAQLPDTVASKAIAVDFATRYLAKYKQPTDFFAGFGYDTAHVLFEGLKAGGDDKAKIRDAIEALTNYNAAGGTYSYSPTDHIGIHNGYFEWKVVQGKFVFVKELDPEPAM